MIIQDSALIHICVAANVLFDPSLLIHASGSKTATPGDALADLRKARLENFISYARALLMAL